ncbi:MAG: SNF2-related protein, partial [Actinomycetota bacterium]|nr:SNF2-related protein [Actinomycetota bacterium]
MEASADSQPGLAQGRVWLLAEERAKQELVFAFPFDEDLNEAVKELPGRWFDWRRKHWRVPAEPGSAKAVGDLLEQFPELVVEADVTAWLTDSDRWRALVSVVIHAGAGAFVVRTVSGDPPVTGLEDGVATGEDRLVFPFDRDSAGRLRQLDGARIDDLARACMRQLDAGQMPAPAELGVEIGEDGEPELTLFTVWDPAIARAYKRLPEAKPVPRSARVFNRDAAWGVAVPADPALAQDLAGFVADHPGVGLDEHARDLLDELIAEHDRASETVALSYADDAELDGVTLGGELHPFQRAGVRYALARRRTFIADEQGLGKTVQALATLEADDAFPAVVVCPASMKLTWEREAGIWLPERRVAVLDGRTAATWSEATAQAEILVLNYDILEAHLRRLLDAAPRALILDESHYVKNPRAGRTKAALELASGLPDDALRLALTGTPILNRPDELIAQLRVLGRLREFGSGARLSRRFRAAGSDDRLHWNL